MSRMGIEHGIAWAVQYLLVASWIWVAHKYGNEIRRKSRSWLRALGSILTVSLVAAFMGGGMVASYQSTPAKAEGAIIAAFLISFVPAILDGPERVDTPRDEKPRST